MIIDGCLRKVHIAFKIPTNIVLTISKKYIIFSKLTFISGGAIPLDINHLGRLLSCCGRLAKLNVDTELRRHGYDVTPAQSHVLTYLSKHSGEEITQRDLEHAMRLKPSTINGIVDRLLEKNYITRCPSPRDGRCRLLYLTESGQEMVNSLRAAIDQTDRVVLADLTDEEQATLDGLLRRIIAHLENEVNKP